MAKRAAPSGASKRRKKLDAEEAAAEAARDERQRKRYQRLEAIERRAYRKIGPPPEDSAQRIAWGNLLAATVGYHTGIGEGTAAIKSTRRTLLEVVRTLGMTGQKALYEQRLKLLERTVYGKRPGKGDGHGADNLEAYKPRA